MQKRYITITPSPIPRSALTEGRQRQMGFSFLKKTDNGFKQLSPFSCCKDYLNDVVYSEITGRSINMYGFPSKPNQQVLKDSHIYVAFKILRQKGTKKLTGVLLPNGTSYVWENIHNNRERAYLKDTINLIDRYKKIQEVLNHVEEKLKIEGRTEIIHAKPTTFIAKAPLTWGMYPYMTSLYSLLIRMSQFYTGSESCEAFLNNYNNPLDTQLWASAKINLAKLYENGIVKQDCTNVSHTDIHSRFGIVYNKFPWGVASSNPYL